MVGVGETLQYGVRDEYTSLSYDRAQHHIKGLIDNEKVAIGQLAAQYKYIRTLIDDLEQLEKAKGEDEIKKLLAKAHRIWTHIARTESREYRAEQEILNKYHELEYLFDRQWRIEQAVNSKEYPKKVASLSWSRELLGHVRKLLEELGAIENNLVEAFSRYEGSINDELKYIPQSDFVKHLEGKKNDNYNEPDHAALKKLITELEKKIIELGKWTVAAIELLKQLMKLGKHLPEAIDRLQKHWNNADKDNGLKVLRSKAGV